MSSPNDLIAALLARRRNGLWFRAPAPERASGEFPAGWKVWFDAMRGQRGTVRGAPAPDFTAILIARELARPAPASLDLSNWQVFAALWRQQWHASEPDQARDRVAAMTISGAVHVLFLLLMSLLAYLRAPFPPAEQGDDLVQVEFIGEGTPVETGGGAPQADVVIEQPEPTPSAPPDAAAPAASAAAVPQPAPAPEAPAAQPQQQVTPPAPQPLAVTETPVPDTTFVLPSTTLPQVRTPAPVVEQPAVEVAPRDVELVQAPAPPALDPRPVASPSVPQMRPMETQVQPREVPLLRQPDRLPELAARPAQPVRGVDAPDRQVRTRDVPLAASGNQQSSPRPAAGNDPAAATTARNGAAATPAAAPAGGRPASSGGDRPAATAGRGADPAAPAGAWPTQQRGDDWGDASRNRPGGNAGTASGLFDGEGRPRLSPGTAAPGGGFPPGSDNWSRDQLDRYGTWAKRPPIGYDPTRFDQYWIPSGTLLQEWVRRGIKQLAIPIPGTTKKINCTISLLQLGGGCGITDPNLQDQEAEARSAPDIPYKPELQEGG
jgi:hypothetical protein